MTGVVYIVCMIRKKLTQIWVRFIDAIGYVVFTIRPKPLYYQNIDMKKGWKMNEAHKLTLCLRHIQIYNLKYTTAYKNGYPGVVVVAISAL